MPQKIELSIPQPCHEDWNKMTPAEQGRFCTACSKTVIDFSTMSDSQVASYFKRPVGSVCGRFEKEQLNRQLQVATKRLPWVKYFFGLVIPAFLLSLKSSGQQALKGRVRVSTVEKPVASNRPTKTIMEEWKEVKGTVLDETGKGIPSASVVIRGTMTGTVTDAEGNFKFNHKAIKPFTIVCSSVGYESAEWRVTDSVPVACRLKPTQVFLGGAVVVTAVKRKPVPLITRLVTDASSRHFSVYPNPVKAGSTIVIENKSMIKGEYAVHISNTAGQQIVFQKWMMDGTRSIVQVSVPPNASGAHIVALQHVRTGKVYTGKIIIQK